MDFNEGTFKQVFEAADQVYLSSKQVSVAAVAVAAVTANLDETQPAFTPQNQPQEVAAVQAKPKKNKKNKNKNQNQGGSSSRGPRHSSNPPDSCCNRHYRHGPDAWFCLAPLTCPWVNKVSARSSS